MKLFSNHSAAFADGTRPVALLIGLLGVCLALSPASAAGPTLTCPGDATVTTTPGATNATVSFTVVATGIPTPDVACTLDGMVITSPHPFPTGTNVVICVASNVDGITNCSFIITVTDGPGCLLVWKFDETNGLVALDSSGNTNHGTLLNGPVRTNGVVQGALRFDGWNDRVRARSATSLNVTGAFTMAVWVRPETVSGSHFILVNGHVENNQGEDGDDQGDNDNQGEDDDKKGDKGEDNDGGKDGYDQGDNNAFAYGLRQSGARVQYRWFTPGGNRNTFATTVNVLTNGSWTHLAVAHLPGSAPMFFINGVAVSSSRTEGSATALLRRASGPFTVGSSPDNTEHFRGAIDEVFICASKLTAVQIRNLTNGLPPGPPPPPPPVGIATASPLPGGVVGKAYGTTLMATGGTPGFTWSLVIGTLPPGLTLNTNSGVISGTPTAPGTNIFTVRVRDIAAQAAEKIFTLVITNQPTCLVHWRFDETNGLVAFDSSGSGHHGTLLNGPIHTNGMVNGGLSFDGWNDRVTGGNPSSLNWTGSVTLAAWVRPQSLSGTRMVIIKGDLDDDAYAWALGASNARLQYRWVSPGGSEYVFTSASNVLALGRWTHIAAVHTPGSAPKLYTNGVPVAGSMTWGSGTAAIRTTSRPFTVGASSDGTYRFLGILDEVFVCRGASSTSSLSNLMAGLPPDFHPAPPIVPSPLPAFASIDSPRVTLRVSGDMATVSWAAIPDRAYRVQFKNSLEETEWQDLLDEVYTPDEAARIEASLDGQPQRFYRIGFIP